MADIAINLAGYGGMIAALLWLGIVPYLQKRKEAEMAGGDPPSFAGAYLTNFVIATITGFISVTMAIEGLESKLIGLQSIGVAAGMGFAFTYTVLGIANTRTELKIENSELKAAAVADAEPATTSKK
jgi:hypothetical protein